MTSGRCAHRSRGRRLAAALASTALFASGVSAHAQEGPLADARVAALEPSQRAAWAAYLTRSRELDAGARASMAAELRHAGRDRMTRAPFAAQSFAVTPAMDAQWLASDSARRLVADIISFQTPSGGWSKHVDVQAAPRAEGQSYFSESDDWQWIGTLDQGSTTAEISLLLAAAARRDDGGARTAAARGVRYLLDAQMPSGCWPQVFPLAGGYHDAAAMADGATARTLQLLREIGGARGAVLAPALRERAAEAHRRGIACVVGLQQPLGAWALFHDPLSGAPMAGRSYEPAALAPLETADLLDELIADPRPDSSSERAAHAAAAWLVRQGLMGLRYESFTPVRGEPTDRLWPRLVSLTDGAPEFSNRDGIPRHDWRELTDRRTGYVWYGSSPAGALERYARWADAHAATGRYVAARSPVDSIARLPGRASEGDANVLLAPERLARLAPAARHEWQRYVERSRALSVRDHAAADAELRTTGRTSVRRAAWAHDFDGMAAQPAAWFATDTARRIGESILSFQTPSGGWSKHVDFRAGVRLAGVSFNGETTEWRFVPTIDNGATTEELRFLAREDSVRHDARYVDAFRRGVSYLLAAQMPNGCWPQVYPLEGGYHNAATFNDDAIVNAARLLREVASGASPIADVELRRSAAAGVRAAVGCMLHSQVVVRGTLTVWGQQHDPLTLVPVAARSYELASLTGGESVGVAEFLMRETPTPAIVAAVDAAAAWFSSNAIHGISYSHYSRRAVPDAPPLWARMVEIETGRPIFANRDGVRLYDYDKLTDRRSGYGWYTPAPRDFLRDYERWRAATAAGTRSQPSSDQH